jgi:hypothetical protein
MTDQRILVGHDTLAAAGENTWTPQKGNKMGFPILMDFYTQMAIEGRVYNVTAGTISEPLIGDVLIINQKAEMAVDAVSGTTIIPVFTNVSVNLGTGTLHEYAGKSVATVSSGGTAFVPLNLLSGGVAAVSTANVDAAGGVDVTAELATTTLRHWSFSQPIAMGAYTATYDWSPRCPPVLVGPRSYYVQIAATGTGPSYYASIDYIELLSTSVS